MIHTITRLDVLTERFHRGLIENYSPEMKDYYWRSSGLDGEMRMKEILEEYIKDQALIVHDLSIDYNGQTQVDFLVMWDAYWWVIEVKNYSGLFTFEEETCYLNGYPLRRNQLSDMQNRLRIMKEVAASVDPRIQVEGSFILVHPHGVCKLSKSHNFEVLTCNEIKLSIEMKLQASYAYHPKTVAQDYEKVLTHQYYFKEELPTMTEADWKYCKKGVRCSNCESYFPERSGWYLICPNCGIRHLKVDLVQNLYQQLCTLYSDQAHAVTAKRLYEFSGQVLAKNTIRRGLEKIVKLNKCSNQSYYQNMYRE